MSWESPRSGGRGQSVDSGELPDVDYTPEGGSTSERGSALRARILAVASVAAALAMAAVVVVPASAAARFDDERPAGVDINPKHQSNWEPTVAVDPNHANRIYQLITGINAQACQYCPGTSVLFRRSIDGGTTFGPQTFVCATACKTIGWQF